MQNGKIAVPTNSPGGLAAERSDHFGHCDCYTLFHVADGAVHHVETVANPGHEAGGCMVPVRHLSDLGVGAIVVGGIGPRPLQEFAAQGITVFFAPKSSILDARSAADSLLAGSLTIMDPSQACKGHGTCHG